MEEREINQWWVAGRDQGDNNETSFDIMYTHTPWINRLIEWQKRWGERHTPAHREPTPEKNVV